MRSFERDGRQKNFQLSSRVVGRSLGQLTTIAVEQDHAARKPIAKLFCYGYFSSLSNRSAACSAAKMCT